MFILSGRALLQKVGEKKMASIEMSVKVCDSEERFVKFIYFPPSFSLNKKLNI